MKVYVRKIDEQCITHQISFRKVVWKEFFDQAMEFTACGITSGYSEKVKVLTSTDLRFDAGLSRVISAEGKVEVGDILVIYKDSAKYDVELVKPNNNKYDYVKELCERDERHTLLEIESNALNGENRKEKFKNWLIKQKDLSETTIENYVRYINYIKEKGYTDYDLYSITDISIIVDLINKFKTDEKYINYNNQNNRAPLSALLKYEVFSNSINDNSKANKADLKLFYIENLRNNDYVESMIKQREKFVLEYPLTRILTLTIEEYCLGLEGYKDSFCNKLEKGEYSHTGFGIGGATAAKFGIYFKKDGKFHGKNDVEIDDPNSYWEKYRQQLYDFIVEMGTNEPNFSIDEKYNLLGGPGGYMYLTKLLSLYYPDRFISMSKNDAYKKLTKYLNIPNRDNAVLNSYYSNLAFRSYVPESNNNFGYYISNAIWKFFKMDEEEVNLIDDMPIIDESMRLENAYSKIYYGIPGCGKSWIANDFALRCSKDDNMIIRTTFYPDYTNSDFVGQIIPKIDENDSNSVLYDIQCGPFTEAMVKAIDNPNQYVCLIVEEINRGNAAAIFGDLFQLLDRNQQGTSEYWIKNYTITEYLKKHCLNKAYDLEHIRIPSNMYIIGTMNTCDQNVFTLDTAFKRRWTMEHISNDVKNSKYKDKIVPVLNIRWCEFVELINGLITSNSDDLGINGEDKQIGSYFISGTEWDKIDELVENNNLEAAAKIFAEKVLSYLWEDVTKLEKKVIFKNDYRTFDNVVKDFVNSEEVLNIVDIEE